LYSPTGLLSCECVGQIAEGVEIAEFDTPAREPMNNQRHGYCDEQEVYAENLEQFSGFTQTSAEK
jgi:hypothetical protein